MIDFTDIVGFDWDEGNINKNQIKHGVSYKEAEEVFRNEPLIMAEAKNTANENRYQSLGITNKKELLSVIFTIRKNKIRVISARNQSRKEKDFYYEKSKEQPA